jgi:hypothetical protein
MRHIRQAIVRVQQMVDDRSPNGFDRRVRHFDVIFEDEVPRWVHHHRSLFVSITGSLAGGWWSVVATAHDSSENSAMCEVRSKLTSGERIWANAGGRQAGVDFDRGLVDAGQAQLVADGERVRPTRLEPIADHADRSDEVPLFEASMTAAIGVRN